MADGDLRDEILAALGKDRTIDLFTTGARTGKPRTTEIWFTRVEECIIFCGTPDAIGNNGARVIRDWLANLKANPEFLFVLKESLSAQLPARAVSIVDIAYRRRVMNVPETKWYRDVV